MSAIATISRPSAPMPLPHVAVTVRLATLDDVPFMDGLQKLHSKQVGWMPTAQFEGKIKAGNVLVAETNECRDNKDYADDADLNSQSAKSAQSLLPLRLGYCIAHDQYFKRDDVGIIYQMNVAPGHQRGLIGARLLKAQFERSAYGCKLYCCWCAQDIAANRFWEAMGFVPLAFRSGSAKKARTHIFWQRRIRSGDETTPYWYPSQTSAGAIREDRLVFPIPPGTHWSDAKPVVLPGSTDARALPEDGNLKSQASEPGSTELAEVKQLQNPKSKIPNGTRSISMGGLRSAPLPEAVTTAPAMKVKRVAQTCPERSRRKNDPRLVAAARELRDRWLERMNGETSAAAGALGKYDVGRSVEGTTIGEGRLMLMPQNARDASPALPAPAAA